MRTQPKLIQWSFEFVIFQHFLVVGLVAGAAKRVMPKTTAGAAWSRVLAPIEPSGALGERVYTSLLESILAGQIVPGQHLVEQVVADQLSVSRISVREAIRRLAQAELVEIVRNRGAFVVSLGPADMEEIFRLRAALEGIAVERLTLEAKNHNLVILENILREMRALEEREDRLRGAAADTHFHRTLMELSGQRRICQVWERMSAQITFVVYTVSNYYPSYHGLADRHGQIIQLIRAGDPLPAVDYLQRHIMEGAQRLLQAMREVSRQ
jgi:DNA-binding GntR family transcriptional regulator